MLEHIQIWVMRNAFTGEEYKRCKNPPPSSELNKSIYINNDMYHWYREYDFNLLRSDNEKCLLDA